MQHFFFIALLLALLVLPQQSSAEIKEIVELVRDSHLLEWENHEQNSILFNSKDSVGGIVKTAKRPSFVWTREGGYHTDLFSDTVIEITPKPTMGRSNTAIRGLYETTLPDMKRVQLELTYDVLSPDTGRAGYMDFYIVIEEKMNKDSNAWTQTGEFRNPTYESNRKNDSLLKYENTSYTTHNYVVNLSEWRGKDVRINLVSELPKHVVEPQTGLWRLARLVTLDFDFIYDLSYSEYQERFQRPALKAKSLGRESKASNAVKSITEYTVGSITPIPLNDLPTDPGFGIGDIKNGPDTSLTGINLNGTNYAYFAAVRPTASGDEQGTFGFRFSGSADL